MLGKFNGFSVCGFQSKLNTVDSVGCLIMSIKVRVKFWHPFYGWLNESESKNIGFIKLRLWACTILSRVRILVREKISTYIELCLATKAC